jgi:butyrate kinase
MLKFEASPEEEFWKVKMERYIDDCSSVDELKQIAKLLVNLSATRQVAIKALVKENLAQWESEMGIRTK